ncbi:DUF4177 domain-containing protein [Chengkuizengella marina]|uniref:DUF4177 domain-containing protein n=1 Tax=Chengkuizengella marina TaxID=2507566 RepID=A0A6N9Q190_9BACL|nr:DUF4177 domain-containing protein [Chengkuizengella marina]NBI28563.1 DUF4177 domain-containing protein [Chengkuizengella marina]
MYEYKFVEANLGGWLSDSTYQEIINEHAKKGWKFVQVLPISYNGHGKPTKHEIIFERLV